MRDLPRFLIYFAKTVSSLLNEATKSRDLQNTAQAFPQLRSYFHEITFSLT